MPTRRIFELAVVVGLLMHPALGLVRMWSAKTLGTQQPGSWSHNIAEVVTVLS